MVVTGDLQNPPVVNRSRSEILRHNNVTVILKWPKDARVSYNVSVFPLLKQ